MGPQTRIPEQAEARSGWDAAHHEARVLENGDAPWTQLRSFEVTASSANSFDLHH